MLAFLGFVTAPIRVTTIYGGLPAHPLFVHVPVVLIPQARGRVAGALALPHFDSLQYSISPYVGAVFRRVCLSTADFDFAAYKPSKTTALAAESTTSVADVLSLRPAAPAAR